MLFASVPFNLNKISKKNRMLRLINIQMKQLQYFILWFFAQGCRISSRIAARLHSNRLIYSIIIRLFSSSSSSIIHRLIPGTKGRSEPGSFLKGKFALPAECRELISIRDFITSFFFAVYLRRIHDRKSSLRRLRAGKKETDGYRLWRRQWHY